MLKKRIIPCLDIHEGRTVKGVNFLNLKDAGDPIELAKKYVTEGADELVFLDISATIEKRKTLIELVEKIAKEINIPFTVGGGISTIEDVSALINAGADKVAINSSAIKSPELIEKIASQFGSQCLVLAIDTKEIKSQWKVFSHGGRIETDLELFSWAEKAIELGAGELLITSMSGDGTKKGFDVHLMSKLALKFKVPIIASGGAGEIAHFEQLFTQSNVTGALAASVFHFNEISIPALKKSLKNKQIEVR